MFASSLLLSLALLPDAEAANVPKIKNVRIRQVVDANNNVSYLTALTPDADAEVASVAAELDGEPVAFTESDAWVHGSAALSAEPADGAELTLTVYDDTSTVLGTFTGTYTDGAVTLTSTDRGDDTGDCTARVGCESSTTTTDLEVLAAQVYADGTVGLDLAGADALSVASASLISVETTTTKECVVMSRTGECVEYGTTTTRDGAELDLDELGIVWESDAVELDGVAELEIKAYDARGKKLDKAKLDLAPAWEDDGEGVSALAIDEDPLTTCGLIMDQLHNGGTAGFVVVSDGWTLGDALPEVAEVELEGGETWTIPANSYQLTTGVELDASVDLDTLTGVAVDGVAMEAATDERIRRKWFSLEVSRGAVLVVEEGEDGSLTASVTTWAVSPDDLPTGLTLTTTDARGDVDADVAFSDEVAVVFGLDVTHTTDPAGMDLVGKVKLRGEANQKGKRVTLAKGKFAGQFGVDGDGEPALAGIDKDGGTVSRGDILIGGEPIDIERTGAPPVCSMTTFSAGQFTRMNAQCATYR